MVNTKERYINILLALGVLIGLMTIVAGFVLHPAQPAHAATTYTVTTNANSGAGSLRQAIDDANANPGADIIVFNAAMTIQPLTALPNITDPVEINGYTGAPGLAAANTAVSPAPFNGTLTIELDGSLAGVATGLLFDAGSDGSSVRGLVINRFGFDGISMEAPNITIAGNYIGTDTTGLVDLGNAQRGIGNSSGGVGDGLTIGGLNATDRNIISGNGAGGASPNTGDDNWTIEGNYIGLGATGVTAIPNALIGGAGALSLDNSNGHVVGGATNAAKNVISGNNSHGIAPFNSDNLTIAGNYIGTTYTGAAALPNGGSGITMGNSANAQIGGTTGVTAGGNCTGECNIISNSGSDGVFLGQDMATTTIEGNYIGTDITGSVVMGNTGGGVSLGANANTNTIGGETAEARNIISGNAQSGVAFFQTGSSNVVKGNYIGTNAAGTADLGNTQNGISLNQSDSNTIGGTTGVTVGGNCTGACNVIAGNTNDGIDINSSDSNTILGNYIGQDKTGATNLGNGDRGVQIGSSATSNTVGGTSVASRNVISGNVSDGVGMFDAGTTGNTILGNYIGTDVTGTLDRGNSANGVAIATGASGNTVGGAVSGAGNVISGNNNDGINIASGTNSTTQGNYIGVSADGASDLGNSADGIEIGNSASNNTIGGDTSLERNVISGNGGRGIIVGSAGSTGTIITGNYIGLNSAGNSNLGNAGNGIETINSAPAITVGGTNSGEGNVISGNGQNGIVLESTSSGSTIIGNIIGLSASGLVDIGNTLHGVLLNGTTAVVIGGLNSAARNIISGNNENGVNFFQAGTGNVVQGNYIGTDVNGTADLGNTSQGVYLADGSNGNTVGGTTAGARNIISGNNENGVNFYQAGTGNVVQGNYIGTDVNGTADIGNTNSGVLINETSSVTVGGTNAESRNIISGNGNDGVNINGVNSTSNAIVGNYIGTDYTGTADLGNDFSGISYTTSGTGNVIGGTTAGARNVVSGNGDAGLNTSGSNLLVQGNYFGLNATGTAIIANSGSLQRATVLLNGSNHTFGGTTNGAGNVVSGGPAIAGILILGTSAFGGGPATNMIVQGNYIGTNASGNVEAGFGNAGIGVAMGGDASNSLIGGTASGAGNVIAGNGSGVGVLNIATVFEAINISILGNSIHSNTGGSITTLGIDLLGNTNNFSTFSNAGVTANDADDPDELSNHLMNFPVISSVTSTNGAATITYNLDINDAEAGATGYRVEFFANDTADPSGHGQGQTYLGSDTLPPADITGRQATITLPAGVSGSKYITATTTMTDASADGFGHTSEFSADMQATLVPVSTNPVANALATTGRNMKWILPLALLLITIGATAIYVSHHKSKSK